MTKTLYIDNLSYRTVDADLERLVAPHAEMHSARVATERERGRPRGFGFVEIPAAAAEAVIGALHGTEFDGRTLKVNEVRPEGERPAGRRDGGSIHGPRRDSGPIGFGPRSSRL